ncbi:RpiB/LacA/LacB family sugar-phosphate isomerase [Thiospirochaeta perfilievii]|uniref:RpiB/LacA/LacB family sugar-phosphate isomerase n=1 Tax=Thiospirochaeta perfilievii TaxID=252967 RepID=A0A5C1QAP7_9SPIO|nr:RpiB/LacA/LacB family sugar-phosphate isomerase [Thiospirochaeta perfilievii]QEN03232.1 RpiB/LacA/LacB family sugar-phosphate isomerase [Thiospirochaeta perfilievii]
MKNVVIANDHGAIELKDRVVKHLVSLGYTVNDLGVKMDEAADYPDKAVEACNEYLNGQYEFGIVCCGTGIGISIAANKVPGIRCALVHNNYTAEMAKNHNNANFLSFGGRIDYADSIEDMLNTFINTDFGGDRHQRRINKIMDVDKLK